MNPHVEINANCVNCGCCEEQCPAGAIWGIDWRTGRYTVDAQKCDFSICKVTAATWQNAICVQVCPVNAFQLAQDE
ncbi:MAG: hypothetical protein P4L27_07905 [Ignavibacteriaceae bacterium]|nr:hypothetical protein [Ignavibacteriaceae bacterium]